MNFKFCLQFLFLLLMFGCNRTEPTIDFGSGIEKNGLQIFNDKKLRFSMGLPYIQNKKMVIQTVSVYAKDSMQTISFTTDLSIQPIEIGINAFPSQNTLIVYMSTKGNPKSVNGDDFIGLSFDSVPGFDIGTAFFKYGSVKAWTYPQQIKTMDSLHTTDNQFFYWKYSDSLYAAMVPLGGNGYMSTLGKTENGKLCAKARSLMPNTEAQNVPLVAIAFDKNPYTLFEKVYQIGLTTIGKQQSLRKNKIYPPKFEKFMWCTWNSFMHTVDEKKILQGLESFKRKEFVLPNLLIDDGWSQVSAYGTGMLQALEVEKSKFPKGLKNTVSIAKNKYGVQNVGVWHAFNGYWAGIDSNSEIGKKYANMLVSYQDKVAWADKPVSTFYAPSPKNNAGFQFYNDWYTYLKSEGIDFVKVDNQLVADRMCRNNFTFAEGATNLHHNVQNAVRTHFDSHVINCMDMTTDAVYNYKNSAVARSSEDFFPENTSYKIDAGNAAIHVMCNVFNATWWSQMVFPDYDMFQTHHPQAQYHAVARAISGGPIYITDTPGKQNMEIISKLIYKNGTIIRSDQPAMPTEDCLFNVLEMKPLKVFSKSNSVGLLAIFNAADAESVHGTFSPSDIPNMEVAKSYILYDYYKKTAIEVQQSAVFDTDLPRLAHQLFYVIPLKNDFAAIGLIGKYNAPKTVISTVKNQNNYEITLVEAGDFVAFSKAKPIQIIDIKGNNLNFEYTNNCILIKNCAAKIVIKFN